MKTAFLDFLESEYSSENLCFWIACEKYRKVKSEEHRTKEGQHIYSQYVCPNAPSQVGHLTLLKSRLYLAGYVREFVFEPNS